MTLAGGRKTPSPGGSAWRSPPSRARASRHFRSRVRRTSSPTIPSSPTTASTRWFATGEAGSGEVRHLTVQFSVFSHLFVEAQLRKVINAADLDTYRAGKEILLNELGVVFNAGRTPPPAVDTTRAWSPPRARSTAAASASAPPTSSGSCASPPRSGLGFADLGKRRHGTPATLFFCDELLRGLRLRGRVRGRGRELRRRALGGRRVLEGADRRPARRSRRASARPAPRVLDLARQGRGPARRPHRRRAASRRTSSRGSTRTATSPGASEMLDGVQAFWDGLWADHEAGVER